jgi:hypothetical protein
VRHFSSPKQASNQEEQEKKKTYERCGRGFVVVIVIVIVIDSIVDISIDRTTRGDDGRGSAAARLSTAPRGSSWC